MFMRPVRHVSGRSSGTWGAMITLALTGDVMLGRGVAEVLDNRMRPEAPWGDVMPLLDAADLRIIDLECAITDNERPWTRTPKVFHFRAQPSAIETLRTARIDGCSLANNHTLDFEEQGLLDTMEHLDAAGIRHAGAGRNREEAADPAILTVPADHTRRVALVAFTDNEPPFAAGTDRPGTNYLPVSLKPDDLPPVRPCRHRSGGGHLLRSQRPHLPGGGDLPRQTHPLRYGRFYRRLRGGPQAP